MTISPEDFKFVCNLVRIRSGISLSDEKDYLVNSRLLPLARQLGLGGISELILRIRRGGNETMLAQVVEAMTTNETSFFRDIKPFEQFKNEIFPHLKKHNLGDRIRIWCSACSTGQEPYSIAITILNNPSVFKGYNFSIAATDINRAVLARAEEGVYSQFEVQRGVPIADLMNYFVQEESYGEKWKIKDNVKQMVEFSYLNLMDDFSSFGSFDIIFCRNVLIYFDSNTKKAVLKKLGQRLRPNGIIVLGGSEVANSSSDIKQFSDVRGAYCV